MKTDEIQTSARANSPQRIIALGIVLAFLYFASSVVMTLMLAVLLAYFLDPFVEFLERLRVPRALGALIVLLAVSALLSGLGYSIANRADQFADAWPRYSAQLHGFVMVVDRKIAIVEGQVAAIGPGAEDHGTPAVHVSEEPSVRNLLLQSVGSLYSVLLVGTFLPFLVFFMLSAKRHVWQATMELFPENERMRVKKALDEVSSILRSYVAGNALIALILMLASWAFFFMIHLSSPFLVGCASGLLTMVPFLGAVLACVPPFLVGLAQWNTVGPFLGVAAMLLLFHILATNLLMPAIVGRRVHLNALAVTIALLFWGWLWGAIGLLLAIPITAAMKAICDHVEGWEPAGHWLGGD